MREFKKDTSKHRFECVNEDCDVIELRVGIKGKFRLICAAVI